MPPMQFWLPNVSASVSYRLGRLEDLERAESRDLGLRVFAGAKVAFVSSTDLSRETLRELPRTRACDGEACAGRQICLASRRPTGLPRVLPDTRSRRYTRSLRRMF